ncbi:glycosyltransferase family 2 protein [Bifidobacterium leontopitheci]|uniref:Glycosyltransferase family 2 n=1 Tax=Bifidobacterium leontopitheci TaxID=2650774 RepID=A0A6I1GFS1_9BIFI|nr:glycosyltransferase family 2 protein [Bifidobacterium leontopitheci]KAB7789542.1 glycosyltransferase family 2 [Bifidobacterium leontopitheci]
MAQNELVSVIVPVYGVEQYLDRCIKSIVSQTYSNLEIILVDDGSPDGCPRMCDDWASRDTRIKVVHKVNGGLASARNAGLESMTGDLVTFIDSDDWVEPDYVSSLHQWMTEHQTEAAMCSTCIEYDDGRSIKERPATPSGRWNADEALHHFLYHQGFTGAVWGRMFLAEIFKGKNGIRFFEGLNSEDYYVHVQVLSQITSIYVDERHLYHYSRRADSITTGAIDSHSCDEIQVADLCIDYLSNIGYSDMSALDYFRIQSRADVLFSLFRKHASRSMLVSISRGMRTLLKPVLRDNTISAGQKLRLGMMAFAPYLVYRLQRLTNRIN